MFSSRGSRLYVAGYGFTFRLGMLVVFLRIVVGGSDQFPSRHFPTDPLLSTFQRQL